MKFVCLTAALALAGVAVAQAAEGPPSAPITADSKAPVLMGKSTAPLDVAMYMDNGAMKTVRGPDAAKAPANATRFKVRFFDLGGGGTLREITLPKGASFPPPKSSDTLVYMVKGHMKAKLGTENVDVMPGDSFRKIAVQDNLYTAVDEVVFVEADAPKQ